MEMTEKSLMPQMSAPVERKLFEAPVVGANGAEGSVVPSRQPYEHCAPLCGGNHACMRRCMRGI